LDLARGTLRDLLDEHDSLGNLERRQLLADERAQLALADVVVGVDNDGGTDFLAELVVGDGKRACLGDCRMPQQHLVDLDR